MVARRGCTSRDLFVFLASGSSRSCFSRNGRVGNACVLGCHRDREHERNLHLEPLVVVIFIMAGVLGAGIHFVPPAHLCCLEFCSGSDCELWHLRLVRSTLFGGRYHDRLCRCNHYHFLVRSDVCSAIETATLRSRDGLSDAQHFGGILLLAVLWCAIPNMPMSNPVEATPARSPIWDVSCIPIICGQSKSLAPCCSWRPSAPSLSQWTILGLSTRRTCEKQPRVVHPKAISPGRKSMSPATTQILMLAAGLFVLGAIGFLTRRNVILMFLSLELMLAGVSMNFIAFGYHYGVLVVR